MNPLTLQLKPRPEPVREAVAWFIAGPDVASWIEEICRWAVPQEGLRLFVLPRSDREDSPAGVLVVLPPELRPQRLPHALGFGVLTCGAPGPSCLGRLYLPVDAQLWPPVEAQELKLDGELEVFHPAWGRTAFAVTQALTVAQLLRCPPSRVEDWNFARAGVALSTRLLAVKAAVALNPQTLFGAAPDEIGTQSVGDLPPAPGEPARQILRRWWGETGRRLAQGLRALLQRLPQASRGRTWARALEDWAAAPPRGGGDLDGRRNQEIHRLLHQLENDPEQGLRYAIPMRPLAHRGRAPPGARLGTRNPDFSLARLRGGHPADPWRLPAELECVLRNKYRELANRELQLGRFRRAAYIFAELLGDLESAASALKQGGHFREAAAVYQDYLRLPREAAGCLAEGGLLAEAIAIYEQESCFLEAGDLYSRMGRGADAKTAYGREVQKRRDLRDWLGAAQLLEEKLGSPEEAFAALGEGWPGSAQAARCLEAQFDLLARRQPPARALALVERLRSESFRPDWILPLTQLLAKQSARYPDPAVRHATADVARVQASRRLDTASASEAALLADTLASLAPQDKLLARDAGRFTAGRDEQLRRARSATPRASTIGPVLVRTFRLPEAIAWEAVKSSGRHYLAAGYGNNQLVLVRGDWEGRRQQLTWPVACGRGRPPLQLEFDDTLLRPACVLLRMQVRPRVVLPEVAFPAADGFPGVIPAGTPGWLPDDTVAFCTKGELVWLLRDTSGGLVESRRRNGHLIGSLSVSDCFTQAPEHLPSAALLVQRDSLWVAAKQDLHLIRPAKPARRWRAETEILALHASAPDLPIGALARLRRGVCVFWAEGPDDQAIAAELTEPLATFTADRLLVLLAEREGRICELSGPGRKRVTPFDWPGGPAVALVRTADPGQFAVFSPLGTVQVFRVPAP